MIYAREWENVFVRNQRIWLSCFKSRKGGFISTIGKGEMKEVTVYTPHVWQIFLFTYNEHTGTLSSERKKKGKIKDPQRSLGAHDSDWKLNPFIRGTEYGLEK